VRGAGDLQLPPAAARAWLHRWGGAAPDEGRRGGGGGGGGDKNTLDRTRIYKRNSIHGGAANSANPITDSVRAAERFARGTMAPEVIDLRKKSRKERRCLSFVIIMSDRRYRRRRRRRRRRPHNASV